MWCQIWWRLGILSLKRNPEGDKELWLVVSPSFYHVIGKFYHGNFHCHKEDRTRYHLDLLKE